MQKTRSKPDHEAYLSTDDIIRRVQLAQSTPLRRWLHTARTLGFVGVLLAGVLVLVVIGRQGAVVYDHPAAKAPSLRDGAEVGAQDASASDLAPAPKDPATQIHRSVAGAHAQATYSVQVTFNGHHPDHLFVDGHKTSLTAHGWMGHLGAGMHQLAVQTNGHMMRHGFEVTPGGVHVTVDPVHHTFVVKGSSGGHRAARLP